MPAANRKKITVIKAGRLIDGNGGAVLRDAAVVVEGRRIKAVGPAARVKAPRGAEIVDARRYTLMPGLIDCHVHVASLNALTFHNYRAATFEITPQLQSFYALFHAQVMFEMGFTTLRDLGRVTPYGQFIRETCAVRDAINMGIVPGPRLITCGRAAITGGHSDMFLPRAAMRVPGAVADGPWELRRQTREWVREGVDVIKTYVSGGGGTSGESASVRNMTQDELDAIVDEAHAFHRPVAAHCFTADGQKMCVKAGVDTIEHTVRCTDETVEMIRESGIPVVPTLLHRTDHAIEVRRSIGTPANVLDKMKRLQPHCFSTFQKMHRAGIKLAMGTDISYDPFAGENAKELEIYVGLGMTPMAALLTATRNAAEALGLGRELGTAQAGKLADFIVVDGDPLRDIRVLQDKQRIKLVMKEGSIYVDRCSPQGKSVLHSAPGAWKILDEL